jgi:hypothetical protein
MMFILCTPRGYHPWECSLVSPFTISFSEKPHRFEMERFYMAKFKTTNLPREFRARVRISLIFRKIFVFVQLLSKPSYIFFGSLLKQKFIESLKSNASSRSSASPWGATNA